MKTGAAFSDHIIANTHKRKHPDAQRLLITREGWLIVMLLFFPLIFFLRLMTLQVFMGSYYRTLSDKNRTRTTIVHAQRGVITDRNGELLAYNIPGFRDAKNPAAARLSQNEALTLIAQGKNDLEVDSLRYYPLKDAGAHVIGYLGHISRQELSQPAFGSYLPTDLVGKTGMEHVFEQTLHGTNGKELIEVDAHGEKIRILGQTDPVPGKDVTLTLDTSLQKAVYEALQKYPKASAVVSTPTGEILALVSQPSYDPNLFTMDKEYVATHSSYTTVQQIIVDGVNFPLMNRVISGVYPPGSTFKLVNAAAGLETGTITKEYAIEDTGMLRVGDFSFGNWFYLEQGGKDGVVNVVKGIARSNDIFFYKLAELITPDKLSAFAGQFGLGAKTGIDLDGEVPGTLPSPAWKKKEIGEQWYLGDTYHYGIGQGFLLTTPLQVNVWTQTIANGGTRYVPHLVKKPPVVSQQDFLSDTTVDLIRQGMIASCLPGGVGWPLFHFAVPATQATSSGILANRREISIACKTGTAQHGGETTEPHAWITLFAPAYNPQVVVTVLVEAGGQGSSVAGAVAKDILTAWFEKK